MALGEFWEQQADDWERWAREPGHDSYWLFHRDRFLELLPRPPARSRWRSAAVRAASPVT
jgi:hypothetical protein